MKPACHCPEWSTGARCEFQNARLDCDPYPKELKIWYEESTSKKDVIYVCETKKYHYIADDKTKRYITKPIHNFMHYLRNLTSEGTLT